MARTEFGIFSRDGTLADCRVVGRTAQPGEWMRISRQERKPSHSSI